MCILPLFIRAKRAISTEFWPNLLDWIKSWVGNELEVLAPQDWFLKGHDLLGEVQNGFRKGRCMGDNSFILDSILMKAKAMKDVAVKAMKGKAVKS